MKIDVYIERTCQCTRLSVYGYKPYTAAAKLIGSNAI